MRAEVHSVVLVGTAMVFAAASAPVRGADDGFTERFLDDPTASGRWSMLAGEDPARFTYDSASGTLLARYDTDLPTARLVRPLGRTLTHQDTFRFRVTFTIRSEGLVLHPDYNAQIAFGLLNSTATGPDRVGFSSDPKAFDLLTLDYFPNITWLGGPSLMPTIVHSNTGQGFWGAIQFEQGAETELSDPGEEDLERDVPLTADVLYSALEQRATLRMFEDGVPLMINFGGGIDGDPFTITTRLGSGGFEVDRFGILLWKDTNPVAAGETTVRADVVFHRIDVHAPAFGDFNGDANVDEADLDAFRACASGPTVPMAPGCEPFDADGDGDVDHDDFAVFQRHWTGTR